MAVNPERDRNESYFGLTSTKYTLFLLNVTYVTASLMAIYSGMSTIAALRSYDIIWRDGLDTAAILWLVVSLICLFVALFGIFSTFEENTAPANIYAALMMVVLILQAMSSISSFTLSNRISYLVSQQLGTMMREYSTVYRVEVDRIQSKFLCCGNNGPGDWEYSDGFLTHPANSYHYNYTGIMPLSCCEIYSDYVDLKCVNYHKTGCFDPLRKIFSTSVMLCGIFGLIFSALQVPGIVFGFYYARILRSKKTQRDMQIYTLIK